MSVRLKRWTRREYDQLIQAGVLGEDDRVQLIEGEIVEMVPIGAPHATATRLVQKALEAAFGPGYDVRAQLPLSLGDDSEPEPDVSVVTGEVRDYRDRHPETAALVVEVSDTTLEFDRGRKGALYARSGIPEYWIVNLPDRVLEVYRQPSTGEGRYTVRQVLGAEEDIAPLTRPEAAIGVGDLFP